MVVYLKRDKRQFELHEIFHDILSTSVSWNGSAYDTCLDTSYKYISFHLIYPS